MALSATDTVPVPGIEQFQQLIHKASSALQSSTTTDHYASILNDNYVALFLALVVSAVLGALIAFHPKRHIEANGPVSDREVRSTQILICVAGAIMVALIQGSLERAFGLVGLGSFVRYRTSLRNPVDLSVIFILIGVGMACGLNLYAFAITITAFIYILLYLLNIRIGERRKIWSLKVDTNEPSRVEKAFREISAKEDFQIVRIRASKQGGGFRCRFLSRKPIDTDEMTKEIQNRCGPGVHFARFEWLQESE